MARIDFGASGPDQPGEPENLTRSYIEVDGRESTFASQAANRQNNVADGAVARRKELLNRPADHQRYQFARIRERARLQRLDAPAAAQHRDPIRNAADFFQPVRDEQDRYALGAELPNDPQQSAGFAFGQRRRRLVHDDHRHLQHERAGNLNDLLLRRGQLSGHSRGIDCSPDSETSEDRSGPPFGFTSRIEHSAQAGLAAEENVLGNAEVGNDHQFLEDRDDPVAPGVGRRRKAQRRCC